jgi:hypothetical protein
MTPLQALRSALAARSEPTSYRPEYLTVDTVKVGGHSVMVFLATDGTMVACTVPKDANFAVEFGDKDEPKTTADVLRDIQA